MASIVPRIADPKRLCKTKRLGPSTPKINTIKGISMSGIIEPTINPGKLKFPPSLWIKYAIG